MSRPGRKARRGDHQTHPAMQANLLMGSVVVLLLLLALLSTIGGR
jgi:hypothetical protein